MSIQSNNIFKVLCQATVEQQKKSDKESIIPSPNQIFINLLSSDGEKVLGQTETVVWSKEKNKVKFANELNLLFSFLEPSLTLSLMIAPSNQIGRAKISSLQITQMRSFQKKIDFSFKANGQTKHFKRITVSLSMRDPGIPYIKFIKMKFRAEQLENTYLMKIFGLANPFLKIHSNYKEVTRTKKIVQSLNPEWQTISFFKENETKDNTLQLQIECWDDRRGTCFEKLSQQVFIGTARLKLKQKLKSQNLPLPFLLQNKKSKPSGVLILEEYGLYQKQSLLSLLVLRQLQLELSIGFDHTNKRNYQIQHQKNYKMLQDFIKLVAHYQINENNINFYGFGGADHDYFFKISSKSIHDEQKPKVIGQSTCQLFQSQIPGKLSGERNFGKLFEMQMEELFKKKRQYRIIVIFTNGDPDDLPQLKKILISQKKSSFSIIVLGMIGRNPESFKKLRHFSQQSTKISNRLSFLQMEGKTKKEITLFLFKQLDRKLFQYVSMDDS